MTPYEGAQLVIQIVAVAALLLTLYVYYRQLRTMGAQLQSARDASSAQNILALTNFLQAPEVRAAREVVRVNLAQKPFLGWNNDEKRGVSSTCCG